MAAFSAAVCLEQLLNGHLNSDQFPRDEIVSLLEKISSLKSSLEYIFPAPERCRDRANNLEIRIRKIVFEAQDTIESFIFLTQNNPPETPGTSKSQSLTSISLEEIIAQIDPIIWELRWFEEEIYKNRKCYVSDESRILIWPGSRYGAKIVGQEKYKEELEAKLMVETGSRLVIPITGMAGVGKTTLARSIYDDDELIWKNFKYKAWVTVSQEANKHDILGKLLNTLESRGQKAGVKKYEGDEAKLINELHQVLSNNKYLVVIDDLWAPDFWMKIQHALPDDENKSRILVTTRITNVFDSIKPRWCDYFTNPLKIEPLSSEDSWRLLRNKTFGDDNACPTELEYYGRIIASSCNGLSLSLTILGGLLSQGPKVPDYWQVISEDTTAATYSEPVGEAYFRILALSLDQLSCKLKACFFYVGAFAEGSNIPASKLIKWWVAEGLITMRPMPQPQLSLEKIAEQSLLELVARNLLVIRKIGSDGRVKFCGMHSVFWNLVRKELEWEMFLSTANYTLLDIAGTINSQRRVFVYNNILMRNEQVCNFAKTFTDTRSLIYLSPRYNHPRPYNLIFNLLRVLDALTLFFLQFPDEILKLVFLRYLSFTYNGEIPPTLSRLQKLQFLIVKRDPICIYVGTPFLPDEIWNMKELRHLIISETDLPQLLSPTEPSSILLENLQTLSNVNATSCTQEVLEHMPNLKKLVMWVEAPGKVGLYLHKLDQLEVFKLTVLDPIPGKGIEFQPQLFIPDTVRKLNLSGCGLPWEQMEVIVKLPNLEVLKLKEFAFHGDEWCLTSAFPKLKFLLIEYLKLKKWEADSCYFPQLEQLIFRHCYDLKEFPEGVDFYWWENLRQIELVDCSSEAVKWRDDIIEAAEEYGYEPPQVRIYSSCE